MTCSAGAADGGDRGAGITRDQKGTMMKRTGIAIVISLMVAGTLFLTAAAFRERESTNGETLSRNQHLFRWERTVCCTCHSWSAESRIAGQARTGDGERIAMVLPLKHHGN